MQAVLAALALPPDHLALLGLICFIAGLVRGFSGFALSAMVMASGALILPPVQLRALHCQPWSWHPAP